MRLKDLHPVKDQNGENLLRDSNKGRNLGVETQSFTETLKMVDANNLFKYNDLWLGTSLPYGNRVPSEAETIERTALVFRTG